MNHTIRKAGALGVVMGILAGMVVGMGGLVRDAAAHFVSPHDELNVRSAGEETSFVIWHHPGYSERWYSGFISESHNSIVVTWDSPHNHIGHIPPNYSEYWIFIVPDKNLLYPWRDEDWVSHCILWRLTRIQPGTLLSPGPTGCFRRSVRATKSSYSETFTGLTPDTVYKVLIRSLYGDLGGPRRVLHVSDSAYIKTAESPPAPTPPETETPEPETPTEPEPETPTPQEPAAPQNLRVEGVAGSTHNTVTVSWETGRAHTGNIPMVSITGHHITLFTSLLSDSTLSQGSTPAGACLRRYLTQPAGCIRRNVPLSNGTRYSETISGLMPETTYYVAVAATVRHGGELELGSWRAYSSFTTTAAPETPTEPEPETPTEPDPETPTTPDPVAQTCTYEHRLIGVPATTGAGYTAQILISSKDSKATVKLRAYQADNGAPIDVLDSDDQAVGSTTSLSPANSIKRFSLEGIRGWHSVIVEHPSKAAMDNATVVIRIREPDTGVSIIPAERIEQCTPATTTAETPTPDLVIRNTQAVLWPQSFDWFASVVNIGDAVAERTTLRVYHGDREIDTIAVESTIAAGSEWRMSDFIRSNRPSVGDVVRICVDPVSGEAAQDRPNNCSSATVERN